MKKERIFFAFLTIFLIGIEVLIGKYVSSGNFVRDYLGDVLIVIVLYAFARIFISEKVKLLPLYVFIFSVFAEILQYFKIADVLGIKNRILRICIGSSFDVGDIICYAAGTAIIVFCILIKNNFSSRKALKKGM